MKFAFRFFCQQLWAGIVGVSLSSGVTGLSDWRWWVWFTAIVSAVALSKSADKWETAE